MKIQKLFVLLLLIMFSNTSSWGDEKLRAANWNFGYGAWLDFSSGTPVSKSGCGINTWEGCSGMSDEEGNLLFYTDGSKVYNRNHQVMPNGKNLLGDLSSSQSGLAFPVPESNSKYFIVSVNSINNFTGLNYSVVDMDLQGGLGDIVSYSKNKNLAGQTCEKVSAVGHSNGKDFWLVTHAWPKSELLVFLVNKDGISLSHKFNTSLFDYHSSTGNAKGYMKFSPTGKNLALASCGIGVHLYDFDNSTGQVSNERSWKTNNYQHAYGIEFSPDGKILYSASPGYMRDIYHTSDGTYLMQINIETNKETLIYKKLGNRESTILLGMQIAIDNKIYVVQKEGNGKYLAVINNPNSVGSACNFSMSQLHIEYGRAEGGLPQFIQSFYNIEPGEVTYDQCEGGEIKLEATEEAGYTYKWTGPNGFSTNKANYTISPSKTEHSGTYTLTITDPDGKISTEEFDVEIKYLDLELSIDKKPQTDIKTKSKNYYFSIENKSPYPVVIKNAYLKSGKQFKLNPVSLPLTIQANSTSTNDISCYLYSDISGNFNDELILEVEKPCEEEIYTSFDGIVSSYSVDAEVCEGGEIKLEATEEAGYTYKWTGPNGFSTDKANYTISPSKPEHSGTYSLTVTSPDGTVTTEEFQVEIKYVDIKISTININTTEGKKSNDYYFTIENTTPFDVKITKAFLEKGTDFKLNTVNYPINIPAWSISTNDISCYLYSDVIGSFNDKLILEIEEPCPETIESDNIKGKILPFEAKIIYVNFPDTTLSTSENARLPLKVRLSENAPEGTKFDLKLTWHYLADVYFTAQYQPFKSEVCYNLDSLGIHEFATGYFYDLELDTNYKKIADVGGIALFNALNFTPLTFDVEEPWSTDNQYEYIIVGEHGSISTIKPECMPADISINYDKAHVALPSSTPMDETSFITAFSPDTGKLTLRIFNLTGELFEEFEFESTDKFEKQIQLNMSKYSNGVYFLAWQSKTKTFRKTIVIEK